MQPRRAILTRVEHAPQRSKIFIPQSTACSPKSLNLCSRDRAGQVHHLGTLRDGAFERSRSVPLTAPAHGLVLHRVIFPPGEGPFAGAAAELDLEEELEAGREVQ